MKKTCPDRPGTSSGMDDDIHYEEIKKALEDMNACQNEIDALNEKAGDEIVEVELKFNELRRPCFEKRNEIIQDIPNFWVTTFANHPKISAILEEYDEDCLRYLFKLEVEEFPDIKSGFKINFHFTENPYFSNEVLTKELRFGPSGEHASKSTQIRWRDGNDLTKKAEYSNTKDGRKRHIEEESFFSWFTDKIYPSGDEIADIIKDEIWSSPLQYYFVSDTEIENGVDVEDIEIEEGSDSSIILTEEEEDTEDYIDGSWVEEERSNE